VTVRLHIVTAGLLLGMCGAGLVVPGHETIALAQSLPKSGAVASPAVSAAPSGPPNALQGFSQNRDKPIRIDAEKLEVRDKQKVATFFGDARADVKVVQGDVTLRSKILVVFYDKDETAKPDASKAGQSATAGPGGGSQIRRLEAKGSVVVTQKDQTVTGDNGVFDMKTNIATVSGSVVMTQCDNVVRGDRLVVDMTTGVSRVENSGGRVQSTLVQTQSAGCSGAAASPAAPAQPSAKR